MPTELWIMMIGIALAVGLVLGWMVGLNKREQHRQEMVEANKILSGMQSVEDARTVKLKELRMAVEREIDRMHLRPLVEKQRGKQTVSAYYWGANLTMLNWLLGNASDEELPAMGLVKKGRK